MTVRFALADDMDIHAVAKRAYALRWHPVALTQEPGPSAFRQAWNTDEGATAVFVEDSICGVRYMVVNGEQTAKTVKDIQRTMRLASRDTIIAEAERANGFDEESEAGRRLLVVAGDAYDPPVFELLEKKFFSNPDPRIRADMIKCFSYAGWKEFRPLLEQLATEDKNEDIREFAKKALEAWDAEIAGKLKAPP